MHNRDKLMKVAFDGIGSFPLSNIVKARQVQQNVVSKNLGKAVHKVEVAANQNIVGRAVIGTAGAVVGTAGTVVKGAGEMVVGTAGFVARGAGKAASRLRGYGPGGAEEEEASALMVTAGISRIESLVDKESIEAARCFI
ncbi:hypothetical protein CEUSTIGMA_g5302.t1 [Chlamydomonas eustigma]|uniref:Uncharacterized protein n=1 Tax=Chlamydomonas eustigma TaxID=1157962 RepID=A0A250X524_9CHLO|nr:hypothetical protein CEUSTIGMA_g5302.t1 [Chlamydomonas eustigma]|eukprot:GAX77860.1 hypothetical protein CEUSTIGMA_g5302.t1 [Chlamydomonas eustigma]